MQNALLTLYFIPSPFGIDWSSPTTLARTIALNKYSFRPRFMGHVNIDIKYIDAENRKRHILTGMASETLDAQRLLIKEKIGLGILWHSFKGKLETKEELIPELDSYKKTGKRINFIRYNINHEVAQNLAKYLKIYEENKMFKYYGLVNSPRHGQGSGCSAFGASFLSIAGLLDKNFTKNCSKSVKAPLSLIGKPITNNKPNFIKMIFSNHLWANEKDPHKEIYFWDPDLMFKYTQKLIDQQTESSKYKVVHEIKSYGIEYPLRNDLTIKSDIFLGSLTSNLPDIEKKSNTDLFSQITN